MDSQTTQQRAVATTEKTQHSPTTRPHVVIVGGGFGGLQAAKKLGEQPVEVTVIDHNNFHLFQPMLYQVSTGGLSPSDIAIPLRAILHKQGNTGVLMAEVTGIDVQEQQVLMGDKQALHYDYLIVATGAGSNYFGHQEWEKLAPGMKSINNALTIRRMVLSAFEAAEREPNEAKRKALLTFVLVGGGPTGVELAGAIAELAHQSLKGDFRHIHPGAARIVLVQGPKRILPQFPASLAEKAAKKLQQMGVEIRTGVHVKDVKPGGVMIGDEHFAVDNVIWTAGVKASSAGEWLHANVDHDGRVKVQKDLSVPGHPNIFVIGDTAFVEQHGKPLPGLAPVAMQEAEYAASVILDRIAGRTAQKPFHYVDKGTLAMVGRSFGIVNIGPLRFTGFLAWLAWIFIHIMLLINFRNRVITVLQYAWTYLTYQRGAQVILPDDTVRDPDKA
jgi:NADH:ubiquinone reductase (H+-translocating)